MLARGSTIFELLRNKVVTPTGAISRWDLPLSSISVHTLPAQRPPRLHGLSALNRVVIAVAVLIVAVVLHEA